MSFLVVRIGRGLFALMALALVATPAPASADLSSVTWNERIAVASGGAYRGPWRMNESVYDYVDDPTVAINNHGFVGVAWTDQFKKDVFFQIYAPDGTKRFDEPVNVSRSSQIFSWLPRVVIASRDAREVYILWQEIVFSGGSHGGEIFFARSTNGGESFSDPVNLSNTVAGAGKGRLTWRYWDNGSLDLVMGPEGNLYAAWTEYEGALWVSRSTDGGASFFAPLRVAGDNTLPARGPSLSVDAQGAVYLAWAVGEDGSADIRFAKSTDRGRSFGEPQIVFESSGHADAPKVAVDGKRIVHLVYAESSAGPFRRYHIRYTRSNDGGRTFEQPRDISSPRPGQMESANFPSLSIDGADNLYVVWDLFPGPVRHPQGLGFAYAGAGDHSFAAPSVVPGSVDPAFGFTGGRQGLLARKLAVNGAGALAVVNSTFKERDTSNVWLIRGHVATN